MNKMKNKLAAMKMKASEMKESPAMEAMESPAEAASEESFEPHQIEDAAHAIMKAEEHKSNPALMKHVNKHLAKKKHAIDAAMGLKKLKMKADSRLNEMNEAE
jgi:hypothetical protein